MLIWLLFVLWQTSSDIWGEGATPRLIVTPNLQPIRKQDKSKVTEPPGVNRCALILHLIIAIVALHFLVVEIFSRI
jgi:hypothetical protein